LILIFFGNVDHESKICVNEALSLALRVSGFGFGGKFNFFIPGEQGLLY
jgi:hypothetical protein